MMYFSYLIQAWTDEGHKCDHCGKLLFIMDTAYTEDSRQYRFIACSQQCIEALLKNTDAMVNKKEIKTDESNN